MVLQHLMPSYYDFPDERSTQTIPLVHGTSVDVDALHPIDITDDLRHGFHAFGNGAALPAAEGLGLLPGKWVTRRIVLSIILLL